MVLPAANANDLELLPAEVRDQVSFALVRSMDEVMEAALSRSPLRHVPRVPPPDLGAPLSHG